MRPTASRSTLAAAIGLPSRLTSVMGVPSPQSTRAPRPSPAIVILTCSVWPVVSGA